ncbi:hypothetical protein KL86CLO1_11308 [uncultured Eubacteriales bacterium]|uniref:Uncharacterized protein n=1 Tax=uncultured Eubacteriales bacterium TaxID=172733 RepID=A0A212JL83_9FIRM|nr:hypothetical protein KL86CLO1_11308 [uncultured Eubacteriales bacterium]
MFKLFNDFQSIIDGLVTFNTLDIDDRANATGVMLKSRVI